MNWRRRRHELQGLDEEIRDHVERETQDNIDRGMTPEAARQEALRKFGNLTRAAEETRAVWRHRWLDHLAQDFRYGARVLRRNPRFAIVVALTLALGIGINTAVFSVINAVLLRPLAHSRPDSLVWVGDHDPNLKREYVNLADFFEWRKRATSYDGMAAFGYLQAALELNHRATQVNAVYTAADFWRILEARPALGRLCASDETSCAVLAWDLFEREYGADPHLIGGAISVNGRPARIAAVLPASFRLQLPMWWVKDNPQPVEAFVSLPPPRERMAQSGQMFALLKPGVRPEQAQTELVALHQRLLEQGGRRALMTGSRLPGCERWSGPKEGS